MSDLSEGILIGGAGGAVAGLTIMIIQALKNERSKFIHKKRIYSWLKNNTADKKGERYRSTRAISSWNNLTKDRVRYICSVHEKIYLSTGKKEDLWSIYDIVRKGLSEGTAN